MGTEDFRPDLYHRLATISLRMPPLRERGGDALQLAGLFLARACGDYGRPQKTLTPDAQAAIAGYRWPGNVRELANVMERVALMTDAPLVDPADLALQGSPERPAAANGDTPVATSGFTDSLDRFERAQLIAALDVTGWNVVQAAQHLGHLIAAQMSHRLRQVACGDALRGRHRVAQRPGDGAGDDPRRAGTDAHAQQGQRCQQPLRVLDRRVGAGRLFVGELLLMLLKLGDRRHIGTGSRQQLLLDDFALAAEKEVTGT